MPKLWQRALSNQPIAYTLYAYANGDPISESDPTGMIGEDNLLYLLLEAIPDAAGLVAQASPAVGAASLGWGIGQGINYACGGVCFANAYDWAHPEVDILPTSPLPTPDWFQKLPPIISLPSPPAVCTE